MLTGSFDDYLIKKNNKEPKIVGVDPVSILSRCGSILQCKQTLKLLSSSHIMEAKPENFTAAFVKK